MIHEETNTTVKEICNHCRCLNLDNERVVAYPHREQVMRDGSLKYDRFEVMGKHTKRDTSRKLIGPVVTCDMIPDIVAYLRGTENDRSVRTVNTFINCLVESEYGCMPT